MLKVEILDDMVEFTREDNSLIGLVKQDAIDAISVEERGCLLHMRGGNKILVEEMQEWDAYRLMKIKGFMALRKSEDDE